MGDLAIPYEVPISFFDGKEFMESTDYSGGIEFRVIDGEMKAVSSTQLWFWADEWQEGEQKVDEYLDNGDYEDFDSMEEFLRTLRK